MLKQNTQVECLGSAKEFGLCVLQSGEFAADKHQIQTGSVSLMNNVVWDTSAVYFGGSWTEVAL